jgi:hypothetical protein
MIKKSILLASLLLVGCSTVTKVDVPTEQIAETAIVRNGVIGGKKGYDVLGLAKYCKTYLKAPRLPTVSTLARSFGDPYPCLQQAANRGGLTDIQVNLRDATCFRNKVCPPGTPSLTDWKDMKKLSVELNNKIATKYPSITTWVSPYLEHDFKDPKVIQQACKVALEGCPTCKCVNEPFSGTRNTGFPLELHNTKVTATFVSGDGASIFDGDNIKNDGNNFQHRNAGQLITFGWWDALNLRCTGMKKFVPINQRTERPTDDHFKQAHKILTTEEDPVPPAPAICKSVRVVDGGKGEILKTNAERYCNGQGNAGDVRADKNLLIIRKGGKRGDKMKVYSSAGKEVGCFAYYGTFETPGTHRWYVGDCSGEKPFQLYNELGSEWGFAHEGGGKCIRFNALRRMGRYR